jgi:serine/threonine protein phosphatase PrpC
MDKFYITVLSDNSISNLLIDANNSTLCIDKNSNIDIINNQQTSTSNLQTVTTNKQNLTTNKDSLVKILSSLNIENNNLYLKDSAKTTWIQYKNEKQEIINGTIIMIGKSFFYIMKSDKPLILKNIQTNEKIKINNTGTIGRTLNNTIQINSDTVSKNHVKIFRENNKYYFEDLNSVNGTIILPNKKKYPINYDTHIHFGGKRVKISRFKYGIFHDIGHRDSFEDTYKIVNSLKNNKKNIYSYFALFDGHSGKHVAKYAELNLHKNIEFELNKHNSINLQTIQTVIGNAIQSLDSFIFNKKMTSGSTVNLCLIHENNLYTANVGDSRSVLCRNGKAIALSFDHKPNLQKERDRIKRNGGFVENNRVNGRLAISRAIGDNIFKNINPALNHVISTPDVTHYKLSKNDDFIVIACDGLWDVMTNQSVVNFIKNRLNKNMDIQLISKEIVIHSINDLGSTDNVTCLIIKL